MSATSGPARLCLLLAAACNAIVGAQTGPSADDARRAQRLVRQLELPEHTLAAARELSALGTAAIPPLRAALRDPRPEVVIACLWAATGIDADLEPLREPVAALLRHEHAGVARAAMEALLAIDGKGSTTLAEHARGQVREIDAGGLARTRSTAPHAMSAQSLPGGNVLIASYNDNCVVEIDTTGKEVWSFRDVRHPLDAERLPGGNTLIADFGKARVIEVTPAGTIAWTYDEWVKPMDVDRLPNGNTLISSARRNGIIEVDPEGNVVWQFPCQHAVDADLLPDGTLLLTLTDQRRVVRVARDGEIRREWKLNFHATDAELLPEGVLLVAGGHDLLEIDDGGAALADVRVKGGGRVARHGRRSRLAQLSPPKPSLGK